jgi:hypothetical protein
MLVETNELKLDLPIIGTLYEITGTTLPNIESLQEIGK